MESSGKHYSEDARGRERTIAELEGRIRALEDELRLKKGQAEDSLQLMQYILDQAQDEASLAGPDGRFYYVNDPKCRSLGYTREELLSMHVWDVDSGLTEEKWVSVWQDIRDHGFKMFETWHRTKHGQLFRTEISATYFDFHGREYLCAFVRDITERKRIEEALQKSEEWLRRACSAGRIGLYAWNVDRDHIYFSPEAYELYGLKPGSPVTYEEWLPCVHPEDRGMVKRRFAENQKNARSKPGLTTHIEYRVVHDDGTVLWLEVQSTYALEGGDLSVRGAVRDITRRRRAEEALRESEEKFRVLADNIPVIAWMANTDGSIFWFNKHCYDCLGLTFEELQGWGWQKVHHPDYVKSATDVFRSMIKTGQPQDNVFPLRCKDGSYRWFLTRSRPIRNDDGTITRWFGTQTDITEQKRAEEALRESEERLRRISRAGRIGLFEWNVDRETVYYSPETYELYGLRPGSPGTYETWLAIVHPDDREMVERTIMEAREKARNISSTSIPLEFRAVHPDGAVLWLLVTATCNIEGGDLMVRGVVRDITERKRAEEALQESERNLARAQAISHIGNWYIDPATEVCSCSDELFRILGISRQEEFSFSEFVKLVHTDDRAKALVHYDETKQEHKQSTFDFRIVRPDGEERTIYLDGEFTVDREGRPHMFGTMQDITERKRAEKELWMNKEKFRVLADTSFGLIAVHNGSNLLYVNNQAEPLTGYTKDELSNMSFPEIFTDDCREFVKIRAFDRLAGKHVPASYEATILTKDGKIKWVNMTAGLFYYEDKPAIITTMFDITDSKIAEKKLKEAKAQAELYVDLMGHDINNFNLVARGYLELIDDMVEDGELKRLVSKPVEAIDGSSRLIQDVQKLQRARSGGNHVEALDLGTLVGEVAGQFKSLSGDKSVNITSDEIKGVRVRANELLRDVFVNLISNAIKHSAVPAYIDIRVVPEEKDGRGYCRVIIDDNGPGVPDDMKEKIFGRLSRGNTKAKGSGLGLYLVKSLVESYGGRVWVEDSVKGDHTKGARFVVELPAAKE